MSIETEEELNGLLMAGNKDGWTVKTRDKAPAAHYEHTVVITKDRPILLTAV